MIGVFLRLYWEFFKTGLFAVGGGMATIPFLKNIGETTGWYTYGDLMNMLAVSESTPGPIGINMATFVGFTVGGIPGAVIATIGEITPCIGVVLIVSMFLKRFRSSPWVERAFYGLRPASTGLIGAACVGVMLEVLTGIRIVGAGLVRGLSLTGGPVLIWPRILLAAALLLLTNAVPRGKDLHPAWFIALSGVIGVLFRFAGG